MPLDSKWFVKNKNLPENSVVAFCGRFAYSNKWALLDINKNKSIYAGCQIIPEN